MRCMAIPGQRSNGTTPDSLNLVRIWEKRGNCCASCGAVLAELWCGAISCAPMNMSRIFSIWPAKPGDATAVAQGVRISAMIATGNGELELARERFLEVIEAFEREGTATTLGDYLTIPRPTTLAQYSVAALQLGRLDEAECELCARSLHEARESGHHLTSCYAICLCAMKINGRAGPCRRFLTR